ncbi:MAG: hypothetical protein ACTSX8_09775, partial [Alphaproteobacteria bacterium]
MHQHSGPMFIAALIASLLVLTAPAGADPGANDAERGWQSAQVQPRQGPPNGQTPLQQGAPATQSVP